MPNNPTQKLKMLYLIKILMERTDEAHPLTVNEIIDALGVYGISAERKSIYTDIEHLRDFGVDIVCDKSRANHYYIGSRDFELAELKLLVDAVQASRFITHKKSRELIKKIEKLTSVHQAKSLQRQVIVQNRIKSMNESAYYNVDAINEAILQNCMIEFKYYTYAADKSFKPRHAGEVYRVSPYALAWAEENYYLMGYYEKYDKMVQFRVDRIKQVKILPISRPVIEAYRDFDVVAYTNRIFDMFGGEKTESVQIEFDNEMINVVIDKFGKDVSIYGRTDESFKVSVEVSVTSTLYSWLFLSGSKAKVIGPEHVKSQVKEFIQSIKAVYD